MPLDDIIKSLISQAEDKDRVARAYDSVIAIDDAKNLRQAAQIIKGLKDLISKYEKEAQQ